MGSWSLFMEQLRRINSYQLADSEGVQSGQRPYLTALWVSKQILYLIRVFAGKKWSSMYTNNFFHGRTLPYPQ